MPTRSALFAFITSVLVLVSKPVRGDDLAPGLEGAELVAIAQNELTKQLTSLPQAERVRLVGTYVAVDPDASDAFAQVACDDDGDHVVVLSEAMLRLLGYVAGTVALDAALGTQRTRAYATFIARSQVPGRRLVPPPFGVFDSSSVGSARRERFVEMVAFVVAREVAHLKAGDLVCASPTTTKENGDDTWTPEERRRASDVRGRIYTPAHGERIDAALLSNEGAALGYGESGALGLLDLLAEIEAKAPPTRWPGYVTLHPGAGALGQASRASAKSRAR